MRDLIIGLVIITIGVAIYFFGKSLKNDVISPDVQAKCNEQLERSRFASEEAKNKFYNDCLSGK